jgi:hypothetical protein
MRIGDASIVFLAPRSEADKQSHSSYTLVDQWFGFLPDAENLEEYIKARLLAAGK